MRMSEVAKKEKLIDKKNNGGKSGVQANNDGQKQKKVARCCIKLKLNLNLKIDIEGGKRLHHRRRHHRARQVDVHQSLHWSGIDEQRYCNVGADVDEWKLVVCWAYYAKIYILCNYSSFM